MMILQRPQEQRGKKEMRVMPKKIDTLKANAVDSRYTSIRCNATSGFLSLCYNSLCSRSGQAKGRTTLVEDDEHRLEENVTEDLEIASRVRLETTVAD